MATVVGMVAEDLSEEEILDAFLDLEREDIREALRFAAEAVVFEQSRIRIRPLPIGGNA